MSGGSWEVANLVATPWLKIMEACIFWNVIEIVCLKQVVMTKSGGTIKAFSSPHIVNRNL